MSDDELREGLQRTTESVCYSHNDYLFEIDRREEQAIDRREKQTKQFFLDKFIKYFLEHPAIAGSIIYIGFSVVGLFYSWVLYRNFQINIFDYAETNDFLMIAFKERVTYFILGTLCILYLIYRYPIMKYSVSKDVVKYFYEGRGKPYLIIAILLYLILVFSSFYYFANKNAGIFKQSGLKISKFNVSFEAVKHEVKQELVHVGKTLKLSLIGSTEKFMFFYNHSDNQTIVIPVSKIISITPEKNYQSINTLKHTYRNRTTYYETVVAGVKGY